MISSRLEMWQNFLPDLARPFAFMSCMLSAFVPTKRCSGLKHPGLSQWWQTIRLLLNSNPRKRWAETRCTLSRRSRSQMMPYPFFDNLPVQFQQPDDGSTDLLRKSLSLITSSVTSFLRILFGTMVPCLHSLFQCITQYPFAAWGLSQPANVQEPLSGLGHLGIEYPYLTLSPTSSNLTYGND